ncbi:uncharacterized protein BDCG_05549 [Blastomyces dermatitidis ER-3]|uniref:Uncharacterized protein n=1 Tax=Ajellomyces dermatitidis (strain ER-3 / ATCC MYA-2586) TaxID=559297 RepID=A0ABP2F153_AJEDR|nr:uncharacterized protein BDCG_05549 [Blastomyces dermatitidis ER-3]EEQ90429.1 hypothetical protein BDCG_05549 [Blastomyces dermatitidis ER-3]EQL32112.1 hypothetical protein BDFG_05691 [Blastomyces dermatitidis ATCC 26199]EQL32113.1 hypothetical protein, variant 1 [Blastomyces dermatitidis ATCC 26199]EQL32114.1 hypothetical protein, variant 2 [Blastomyces dermatitidis ATCC 26199]
MQFKFFSILALAATCVVADEAVEKRNLEDQINSIATRLQGEFGSTITAVGSIPPQVASALGTAIPRPTDGNIQGYFSSLVSEFNDGSLPAWFTGLPDSARNFLSSKAAELATTRPPTPTTPPTPTADESGNHAPAARPTGAMMGSLVGAAGVLGLAVML